MLGPETKLGARLECMAGLSGRADSTSEIDFRERCHGRSTARQRRDSRALGFWKSDNFRFEFSFSFGLSYELVAGGPEERRAQCFAAAFSCRRLATRSSEVCLARTQQFVRSSGPAVFQKMTARLPFAVSS
jgi:hypothetical protein